MSEDNTPSGDPTHHTIPLGTVSKNLSSVSDPSPPASLQQKEGVVIMEQVTRYNQITMVQLPPSYLDAAIPP